MEPKPRTPRKCMSPTSEPEMFFKIIFPDKKLRIPKMFVQKFGNQLSPIVTVNGPNGGVWKLGLEKENDTMCFSDDWEKFLDHYSLSPGQILIFKYEGNSVFNVLYIFDISACKIGYHNDNLSSDVEPDSVQNDSVQNEEENDFGFIEISDSTTYSISESSSEDWTSDGYLSQGTLRKRNKYTTWTDRKRKRKRKHIRKGAASQSCKKCVHGGFAEEDMFHSSVKGNPKSKYKASNFSKCSKRIESAKKRARKAAEMFQSEHPFFKAVLRRHNIYNSFVYVPAGFALKYLSSESIKLQNDDGKQWPARCFYREGSGAGRSIGKGWATFARENDLEEGDVVVFELIDRNTLVLEVSIFRMVEFLDNVNQ